MASSNGKEPKGFAGLVLLASDTGEEQPWPADATHHNSGHPDRRGADTRDEEGRTPLHRATWNNQVEPIRDLLDAGADPNARDKYGKTPLHAAALHSKTPAVVQALLDAGADLNARDKNGKTPLDRAKERSQTPVVIQILQVLQDQQQLLERPPKTGAQQAEPDTRDDKEQLPRSQASPHAAESAEGAHSPQPLSGTDGLEVSGANAAFQAAGNSTPADIAPEGAPGNAAVARESDKGSVTTTLANVIGVSLCVVVFISFIFATRFILSKLFVVLLILSKTSWMALFAGILALAMFAIIFAIIVTLSDDTRNEKEQSNSTKDLTIGCIWVTWVLGILFAMLLMFIKAVVGT